MTKIIQIMPAPAGLVAVYETEQQDGSGRDVARTWPVSCLALVETTDWNDIVSTEVRAMRPFPDTDSFVFADWGRGFIGITHE